jgi:hypothetical protein
MKVLLRHVLLCALPLLLGLGASYGFAYYQQSCGRMVGALFAAKCRGRQLQYQMLFQTGGTGLGTLLAGTIGAWLEHRRRRAVQRPDPTGEQS